MRTIELGGVTYEVRDNPDCGCKNGGSFCSFFRDDRCDENHPLCNGECVTYHEVEKGKGEEVHGG